MGKTEPKLEYTAEIYIGPQGGYCIDFPYDAMELFGTRSKVKIKVWIDGFYQRKSLLPKGNGSHYILVNMEARAAIGKNDGEKVSVVVEHDTEPRTVDIPEELQWLLDNEPDLKAEFGKLPYSARKFYISWIMETKDPDKKVKRINRVFEVLHERKSGKRSKPSGEETDAENED